MPPSNTTRVFLAADLDNTTRSLLLAHLDEHVGPEMPGRPVAAANWHITLRSVGTASPTVVDRLIFEVDRRLDDSVFDVGFGGLGAFPKAQRASVLWLGVRGGASGLRGLAEACEAGAVAAGFDSEGRPFHPHVTLSRIRPVRDVGSVVEEFPGFAVSTTIDAVTLFASHLGPGGARYEALERFELSG